MKAEFNADIQLLGQLLTINTVSNECEDTQKSLEHSGKAAQGVIASQNGRSLYSVAFKYYSIVFVYVTGPAKKDQVGT